MNEKLINLLNHIGINEDYIKYFKNSYVDRVMVDKEKNSFIFFIKMDNIPHIKVYEEVLECLKKEFHNKAQLKFFYEDDDYKNIESYFNIKRVQNVPLFYSI